MLIHLTNTNSAPAEASMLPGVADHLRAQLAREQARILEMARSIEKGEAADPCDNLNITLRTRYLLFFGEIGALASGKK